MKLSRIRGAGTTLIAVALVSSAALTTLGQRQYVRLSTEEVWAVANAIPAGQTVQAADLTRVRIDNDSASLAIADATAIVGRRLTVDKQAGDVINQGDIAAPRRNGLTDVVPEGRVVYTLAPDRQLLPYARQLRAGDSFDILATAAGGRVTPLAYDVLLLGTLFDGPQDSSATVQDSASVLSNIIATSSTSAANSGNSALLVLAVKPEHVYPLASAMGSSAKISLVAHGKTSGSSAQRLSVAGPAPRQRAVEVYTGLQRNTVTVDIDCNTSTNC
jgi:hypothetical protein